MGGGTPVSSTNKTDRHELTEILLKVVLNTIKQTTNRQYIGNEHINIFHSTVMFIDTSIRTTYYTLGIDLP